MFDFTGIEFKNNMENKSVDVSGKPIVKEIKVLTSLSLKLPLNNIKNVGMRVEFQKKLAQENKDTRKVLYSITQQLKKTVNSTLDCNNKTQETIKWFME